MDGATPGTILQCWACNMSLGLGDRLSAPAAPCVGWGVTRGPEDAQGERLGGTETAERFWGVSWLW